MHRAALEGVVEILAVRRGAVDERGARGAQRAPVADRGAGPVLVPAGERAADIVLVARGDAEADHIDQRLLAFLARGGGQLVGIDRSDALGQMLGNGDVGKFCVHL